MWYGVQNMSKYDIDIKVQSLETGHGHTLLVDTQGVVTTPGSLRGQTWVNIVYTQVHQGGSAGNDSSTRVDEGM